uniref:Reverse transcriptase domain-containing protein n=1 Tax=Tanacetum cinerariifolium TaxID=118510 RepID=A0A699GIZ2_TANCI|nr:reverse transcriptase domain-containing protein [Tanacetum cinerariifolium]
MSSNSDDIQAAGSDTRPPMLDRTDYDSWSQRIRLYCTGKENGINILQSINNGPFELGTTRDTLGTTPEGGVLLGPERPRTYDYLNDNEKKRFDADVRATNIVLQGLPKDIYKLINHNIKAKAIWDNVKMLFVRSELTKEDIESQLYDEFECFKMLLSENINEYYFSDDEDTENDQLPKADMRKDWWKPLPEEERPATSEPAWTITSSNIHALLISKMKVARYPNFGLEPLVLEQLWIDTVQVRTHMRILSVVSIKVYSIYGYDYLSEIVLRRADFQEHTIAKKVFKNLHPNDFEYLNMLLLQGWDAKGYEFKHDYTIIESPRAVVFRVNNNARKIMRFNKIYKFSYGTLIRILEALDYRVKEFKIKRLNPAKVMSLSFSSAPLCVFLLESYREANLLPTLDNLELTIRRRSRADPTLLNDFEMAAEGNGDPPVPDLRTMEELCQPSLNGRGGPIAPIAIQAMNFGLKNDIIQQSIKVNGVTNDALRLYLFPHSLTHHATAWFDRLPRNSINTFEKMAKIFLGKYFPPSMVTKLRNEITYFRKHPYKSLFEACERYKLSIDRCPNHNMLPVTQIDTFYHGLTLRHRDTINVAAGRTFMKRRTEECYDLIKNMTAHHNDWDTLAQQSESSSSVTSSSDPEIVALKAEMAEINKNLMRVLQLNQQVKAVTPNCETCGGPHSYNDCPATISQTQNVYAARAYQAAATVRIPASIR